MKKKPFIAMIMDGVKKETTLETEDLHAVENAITGVLENVVIDVWTIPDVQERAETITGHSINTNLAGMVTEKVCECDLHGVGITNDLIDQQISHALKNRYSDIMICPATDDIPPQYPVDLNIADKFIAIGVIAETEYPIQEGDHEIIVDIGSDQNEVRKYADRLLLMTSRAVELIEDGPDRSPSM